MGALPRPVEEILDVALVCEFTVIDPKGRPVTHPMIPIYDGDKIWLHSSILFSKKLEHVKANPKVAISLSDRKATHGVPIRHRATIQGEARVFDEDPHRDWERILPLWIKKEPIVEPFSRKRVALPLFWERGLIEVTPVRALLWENGDTGRPPEVFELAGAAR